MSAPRALTLVLLGVVWAAATMPAAAQSRPSETDPPPSCLDQSIPSQLGQTLRRRGVQKRTFLKRHRFELFARGGLYASDLLSSSYDYGGGLAWFFAEDFGLEATFDVTPVALDLDAPVAGFFGDPRFEKGTGYLVLANLLFAPIHFKLKTSGGSILHGDAMFAAGGGRLLHETAQGFALDGGLVVEVYAARWLSLRFDVRDVMLVQEAVAETRFTHNVTALFGVGLWLPFGF